jgi:hypothetical protein
MDPGTFRSEILNALYGSSGYIWQPVIGHEKQFAALYRYSEAFATQESKFENTTSFSK